MNERSEREVQALEEALAERTAELDRFTRSVSHELRNPLVTARAFLGFLEMDLEAGDAEKVATDIHHLKESVARMERSLAQLVSWARSGRLGSRFESVSFADVAREAVDHVAGQLADRGAEVEVAESLPVVRGDRQQLVDLVRELVSDASRQVGRSGALRIEVGARVSSDGETVLTVCDDRADVLREETAGAEEAALPTFEKLSTGEGGLGLALARRIVRNHGGRIWVEPRAEGAGCCLCFTLAAAPRP